MSPDELHRAAAAEHPRVELSLAAFEAAWRKRGAPDSARAADVYLAAAIEAGQPQALEWLKERVRQGVTSLGARLPDHLRADVESEVLAAIAVSAPGRPARIADYAARGPLLGWLQVIVTRAGLARSAAAAPRLADEEIERAVLEDLEQPAEVPELAALKSRFHGVLGPSLRAAAAKLDAKSRALISMHYLDSVPLEEIARAYQVHRATAARWIANARESFLEATRDELSARANLNRLEVDSVVRVLQSQVDVSLRRVLK